MYSPLALTHTHSPLYAKDLLGLIQELVIGECSLKYGAPASPLVIEPVKLVKQALQRLLHVACTQHKPSRNAVCIKYV